MAYTSHVDVLLILTNGNGQILFALHQGTGYCDGPPPRAVLHRQA